jgi:hypothetical protein
LDDDIDDDNICFELRDEDPDIEEDYTHSQNAHFAAVYCASKGFFGGFPSSAPQKTRMTNPFIPLSHHQQTLEQYTHA